MVSKPSVSDEQWDLKGKPDFPASGCNPDARRNKGPGNNPTTCSVRYGLMDYVGEFRYGSGVLSGCGRKVVIQTGRGIEIGERLRLTCTGCNNSISREQMVTYVKHSGSEAYLLRAGRVLREATPQDIQEETRINEDSNRKLAHAIELSRERDLPMKFIACEHLFGGERIIFHFMSEQRVDFRDLVRELAHEYHTRIEMHQIGARDEARLVADYEVCGRECCCKNFLKKLRPVTMRMAKLQKATLDPSKVSGRCGRLRCCLRFEHEGYEELNKTLPRIGARVRTERGTGTVKERQVLTQLLTVEYDDNNQRETLGVEAVLGKGGPKQNKTDQPQRRDKAKPEKGGSRAADAPEAAAAGASSEHRYAKESPNGAKRSGKRRRSSRRRRRPNTASSPPVEAADSATTESKNNASTPSDGDVGGVSPGLGSETESPPGTPAESSTRNQQPRRRGRRGRRRRKPRAGGGASDASASGPPEKEKDRKAPDQ